MTRTKKLLGYRRQDKTRSRRGKYLSARREAFPLDMLAGFRSEIHSTYRVPIY